MGPPEPQVKPERPGRRGEDPCRPQQRGDSQEGERAQGGCGPLPQSPGRGAQGPPAGSRGHVWLRGEGGPDPGLLQGHTREALGRGALTGARPGSLRPTCRSTCALTRGATRTHARACRRGCRRASVQACKRHVQCGLPISAPLHARGPRVRADLEARPRGPAPRPFPAPPPGDTRKRTRLPAPLSHPWALGSAHRRAQLPGALSPTSSRGPAAPPPCSPGTWGHRPASTARGQGLRGAGCQRVPAECGTHGVGRAPSCPELPRAARGAEFKGAIVLSSPRPPQAPPALHSAWPSGQDPAGPPATRRRQVPRVPFLLPVGLSRRGAGGPGPPWAFVPAPGPASAPGPPRPLGVQGALRNPDRSFLFIYS